MPSTSPKQLSLSEGLLVDITEEPPSYSEHRSSQHAGEKPPPPSPLSPVFLSSPGFEAQDPRITEPYSASHLRDLSTTTALQVRDTLRKLITHMVCEQTPESNQDSMQFLQTYSRACAHKGINFLELLSEPFIHDHTPLYWAIAKRPSCPSEADRPSVDTKLPPLVRALLGYYAEPICASSATRKEIELACLLNSDQWLYECIQTSSAISGLSKQDQLLFGVEILADYITIDTPKELNGPLTINFVVPQFQKRLVAYDGYNTRLTFIAFGRVWVLTIGTLYRNGYGHNEVMIPTKTGELWARLKFKKYDFPWAAPMAWEGALHLKFAAAGSDSQAENLLVKKIQQFNPPQAAGQKYWIQLPDSLRYAPNAYIGVDGILRGNLVMTPH
ncbi:hypothetical protein HMN09_00190500 [Mycena chlorophos]|uniref:Uncharacterized protein n=1 Tax=Mycena chlorophos TaxID=658473 RepID=A0A8H6WNA0_MYCCL|nr:hypothetical protein HMN09_00190500 [Mycena chlorophos]